MLPKGSSVHAHQDPASQQPSFGPFKEPPGYEPPSQKMQRWNSEPDAVPLIQPPAPPPERAETPMTVSADSGLGSGAEE
eukprot:gene10214-20491_t